MYNFIDLLGDLGGLTEIILLSFGFIFFPISEYSFYLKAIRHLFLAKTSKDDIFIEKKDKKIKNIKDIVEKLRKER